MWPESRRKVCFKGDNRLAGAMLDSIPQALNTTRYIDKLFLSGLRITGVRYFRTPHAASWIAVVLNIGLLVLGMLGVMLSSYSDSAAQH